MSNYLPIMHKSALLFITSSATGGWHHVEVHEEWWWIARMQAHGFIFSSELTDVSRKQAMNAATSIADAQHLKIRLLVFINPRVASLPQHQHLIGGNGCFRNVLDNRDGGIPCIGADALPLQFESLLKCNRTLEAGNRDWRNALWKCGTFN
jgi:hypothetical protein